MSIRATGRDAAGEVAAGAWLERLRGVNPCGPAAVRMEARGGVLPDAWPEGLAPAQARYAKESARGYRICHHGPYPGNPQIPAEPISPSPEFRSSRDASDELRWPCLAKLPSG